MFSGFMGIDFFVFTTSLMDYETNKDAIMKLFKRPFKVKGERISFFHCDMWNHQRSRSQRDRCIDRLSGISGTVKT